MQQCYGTTGCLTLFIVVLSLMASSAADKPRNCCTKTSIQKITSTIIGARLQQRDPPCVKAVIFETEDGEVCSHWREAWVRKAVFQLEEARKSMNALNTTTFPETNTNNTKSP
uniref:Chemokine interleukin-8-like domain-containing protein n=1 Tax=Esox lucius TaxID=8010 RepID=A0A3P8ZKN6_ESOLU